MSGSIERFKPVDATDDIVAALHANGVAIVEGLLDPGLLGRFNAELDDVLSKVEEGRTLSNPAQQAFHGPYTRHLSGVARHSRIFVDEVLLHPFYERVCDAVLLDHCANYRLNVAHVLDRGPGSDLQYPHRDGDVWAHMPRPHPIFQLASVIALTDFSAENGATRVIPGSHRWEPGRQPQVDELVAAEMSAGSAVVYLNDTIHCGGPNTTEDRRRRAMHLSYVAGWLRTEENNYLVTPLEMVRDFPKRAQALLGYAVHDAIAIAGGSAGLYDANDPLDLMEQGLL